MQHSIFYLKKNMQAAKNGDSCLDYKVSPRQLNHAGSYCMLIFIGNLLKVRTPIFNFKSKISISYRKYRSRRTDDYILEYTKQNCNCIYKTANTANWVGNT